MSSLPHADCITIGETNYTFESSIPTPNLERQLQALNARLGQHTISDFYIHSASPDEHRIYTGPTKDRWGLKAHYESQFVPADLEQLWKQPALGVSKTDDLGAWVELLQHGHIADLEFAPDSLFYAHNEFLPKDPLHFVYGTQVSSLANENIPIYLISQNGASIQDDLIGHLPKLAEGKNNRRPLFHEEEC